MVCRLVFLLCFISFVPFWTKFLWVGLSFMFLPKGHLIVRQIRVRQKRHRLLMSFSSCFDNYPHPQLISPPVIKFPGPFGLHLPCGPLGGLCYSPYWHLWGGGVDLTLQHGPVICQNRPLQDPHCMYKKYPTHNFVPYINNLFIHPFLS